MATYASSTNPFIKADSGPERPLKKDAPGMAMQQSLIDKMNRKKENEANLLLSHEERNKVPREMEKSAESKNWTDIQLGEILVEELFLEKTESSGNTESESNPPSHSNHKKRCSSDSDEIMKACENLVEATVRLELEESKAKEEIRKDVNSTINCLEQDNKDDVASLKGKIEGLGQEEEEEGEDENDDNVRADNSNEAAPMEKDNRQHQHIELIKKLRLQLRDLERYAYERGELEQIPPSLLAERQSVILDTLRNRLSLNINMNEINKLELDELKRQVDKEIHDLIDPLITKEHLLCQLKTQLTDLERYIAHLHGTLGKMHDKKTCSCHLHGCSSSSSSSSSSQANNEASPTGQDDHSSSSGLFRPSSIMNNDALPKTSRLIRSLVTQLICSDIKLQERAKKETVSDELTGNQTTKDLKPSGGNAPVNAQNFHDDAAWSLHIDRVILATDSLVNLLTLEPEYRRDTDKPVDETLVESIVRRQLLPALRNLLSYGLIDPDSFTQSNSYASFLFDPYYILSSLTCFPSSQKSRNLDEKSVISEKVHIWTVIEDYYKSRNEPSFRSSSVKTLSQSFNLAPSISGPIKITSKQALLITLDDIIETLAKCKPNGPESHFKAFIYHALNKSKLPTWLRLIFKNKSIVRKYYHNHSFVGQSDKMDKFLTTIETLNRFVFNLKTDVESIEQFVSAF